MDCPRCRIRLNRMKNEHGTFFVCPRCDGRAVGIAPLRRLGTRKAIHGLWQHARECHTKAGMPCPECRRPMVELPLSDDKPEPSLDVCARCHFVWFDPGELKQFPRSDTPKPRQLPQKAREQIAMLGLQQDANRARREAYDDRVPEEWWHVIPAMFGMPVEEDSPAIRCRPWLTYGLAAALVVVYTLSVGNLQAVVEEFGLVPAQLWRYGGATFFTNFFLHGDPLHPTFRTSGFDFL